MLALENNIKHTKERINTAAERQQANVELLAVSKTQSASIVQQAYDLGLKSFGENYLNEAQEKIPQLPNDIQWHFIGPIQSNKTASIAKLFSWVHSIDRLKIAQRLSSQRDSSLAPLNVLIQVNISKEPQKSGCLPEQVLTLTKDIIELPQLTLRGLMAIPAANNNEQQSRQDFAQMNKLYTQLQESFTNIDTLSMGMSKDCELAIEYGANIVRIGTDIFGARQAKS